MYLAERAPRVRRGPLSPGKAGTVETVRMMRTLVREGVHDVAIRDVARRVIVAANARRPLEQLHALFRFVSDRVPFIRDPHDVELLQAPWVTLRRRGGDCDDKAILLAALIQAARLPFRVLLRVIGADPTNPARFSHVYTVASIGGRTIALDATHAGTPFGWEYPKPSMLEDYPA